MYNKNPWVYYELFFGVKEHTTRSSYEKLHEIFYNYVTESPICYRLDYDVLTWGELLPTSCVHKIIYSLTTFIKGNFAIISKLIKAEISSKFRHVHDEYLQLVTERLLKFSNDP